MTNQIIWTSKLTEERVKKEWEETRERCPWANLGPYEENKESAWESARSRNDEELLYLNLSDRFAEFLDEEDEIEIFKEGEEKPVTRFKAGDDLTPDICEVLFACVEYVSVYEGDATLRMGDGNLWIDVDWEDWLTKEKGTYHYMIKINGQPAQI